MELRLKSGLESRLKEHAEMSGCTPDELVSGLVEGYLKEAAEIRAMLQRRLESYERGEVELIEGEEAFKLLRERAVERLKKQK